jgi:iron-sulfur cluster assembly protein
MLLPIGAQFLLVAGFPGKPNLYNLNMWACEKCQTKTIRVKHDLRGRAMSVMLTERAAAEVKRYQTENSLDGEVFLRVGAVAGGCSGYSYKLEFDEHFDSQKDDQYDYHGVKVVVDKRSALLLEGTTIDWYESLEARGFKFDNPNVTKSCGCGSSFQV